MSWNNRSYFSSVQGAGGNGQYYSYTDRYVGGGGGGQHYAAGGGKKLPAPSRLKKASGGKKASDHDVDHYPSSYAYGTANNHHHNGGYDNRGGYNGAYGSRSSPYSNNGRGDSGGGYNNSYSSYGNGYGAGGGAVIPYNAPGTYWAPVPQDGTRSPMFISTKEVNVYAMPGTSQYGGGGGYSNDQKRRGGGFFRPALEAVGHFFDRKLGFHDRD